MNNTNKLFPPSNYSSYLLVIRELCSLLKSYQQNNKNRGKKIGFSDKFFITCTLKKVYRKWH